MNTWWAEIVSLLIGIGNSYLRVLELYNDSQKEAGLLNTSSI